MNLALKKERKKKQMDLTEWHILAVLMDMIAFLSRWEGCVWQHSLYNWAVGRGLVWRENWLCTPEVAADYSDSCFTALVHCFCFLFFFSCCFYTWVWRGIALSFLFVRYYSHCLQLLGALFYRQCTSPVLFLWAYTVFITVEVRAKEFPKWLEVICEWQV